MALKLIVKLWALAPVSGLLPVTVPLNDDANGTQWGPVTADISANRCRAFAVDFEGDASTVKFVTWRGRKQGQLLNVQECRLTCLNSRIRA